MSLSIYMKGDYEEFHALKAAENKANSKPNKANPSGTNCRTGLINAIRVYSWLI